MGCGAAARGAVREAVARHGRVDALLNVAGVAPRAMIGQTDDAVLWRALSVNALGPAAMLDEAWSLLLPRDEALREGWGGRTPPFLVCLREKSRARAREPPTFSF